MRPERLNLTIARLLSVIAAIALLLAPVSIAEAAATTAGHEQMMQRMSCHMPAGSSTHQDKMAGKICCASTGVAVAIAATTPSSKEGFQPSPFAPSHVAWHVGYLGEIATPPPRLS